MASLYGDEERSGGVGEGTNAHQTNKDTQIYMSSCKPVINVRSRGHFLKEPFEKSDGLWLRWDEPWLMTWKGKKSFVAAPYSCDQKERASFGYRAVRKEVKRERN